MWAVFAPGPLAAGMALFMEKMTAPQYAGVDLYSRAQHRSGTQVSIEVLGFTQGVTIEGIRGAKYLDIPAHAGTAAL